MRVHAVMVTKNESGRYLRACLEWLTKIVDGVYIYDDRSDDDTVALARHMGCKVSVRDSGDVAFLEDESAFRQQGWSEFERLSGAHVGDWCLAIDADEFLIGKERAFEERESLADLIDKAKSISAQSISFPILEVFDWQSGPMIRTDGFWGTLRGTRLIAFRSQATFAPATLGGGSVPIVQGNHVKASKLVLLHLGYLNGRDKQLKYERYLGREGHHPRHVDSIIQHPTTVEWRGKVPLAKP